MVEQYRGANAWLAGLSYIERHEVIPRSLSLLSLWDQRLNFISNYLLAEILPLTHPFSLSLLQVFFWEHSVTKSLAWDPHTPSPAFRDNELAPQAPIMF